MFWNLLCFLCGAFTGAFAIAVMSYLRNEDDDFSIEVELSDDEREK